MNKKNELYVCVKKRVANLEQMPTDPNEANKENTFVFRTNTGAWAMLQTVPPPVVDIDLQCLEALSPRD